jgi:hypothetical protein
VNEREQLAHDTIANYVAAKFPRYHLTQAGEALLAANADRLTRVVRQCGTCGTLLPRGRIRFCSLGCWKARE